MLLLVAGCGSSPPADVVTRSAEPDVVRVQGEDVRLEEARRAACAALPEFVSALQSADKTQKRFSLKAEFTEGKVHEFLWLRDIKPEGSDFIGTLSNQPIQLKKLELGQRLRVKTPAVTDWMYIKNGVLVGGYTIRILAETLTPEARANLEKEGGFRL